MTRATRPGLHPAPDPADTPYGVPSPRPDGTPLPAPDQEATSSMLTRPAYQPRHRAPRATRGGILASHTGHGLPRLAHAARLSLAVAVLGGTLALLTPEPTPATSASATGATSAAHVVSATSLTDGILDRAATISRGLERGQITTRTSRIAIMERVAADALAAEKAERRAARQARIAKRKEAARQARIEARREARREARIEARREARAAAAAEQAAVTAAASVDPGSLRAMARDLMLAAGYAPDQWPYLDRLVARESGWNPLAQNPSSGAYGLPQALPGSKMAAAGADWQTNPATQMTWMIEHYIKVRYGSPQNAWAHSQTHGWY